MGDRSRPNIDRFSDRLTNIGFISEYHVRHVCLAGRGTKKGTYFVNKNATLNSKQPEHIPDICHLFYTSKIIGE